MRERDPVRKSILVVEDDKGIRGLLVTLLGRAGYAVDAVSDGDAALTAFERKSYGAAILDIRLPHLDGFEVLRSIESTRPEFLPCIVILSAVPPAVIQKHAVSSRVARVLSKPFELEELVSAIAGCVRSVPVPLEDTSDVFLGIQRASASAHAKAGVVAVVDQGAASAHLLWTFGYQGADLAAYATFPISRATPIGAAILTQMPVFVRSRAEAAAAFAQVLPMMDEQGTNALAAAPVFAKSGVVGAIGWTFGAPQVFEEEQRGKLLAIAAAYSVALAATE